MAEQLTSKTFRALDHTELSKHWPNERHPEWCSVCAHADAMEKLEQALRTIAKGEGRFSRDPLTHACNTIEDMKAIAVAALAGGVAQEDSDS